MNEVVNHQNNDNSSKYELSNLYNYTYTMTYTFFDTPYWNQVYRGYGYLWMEASEIFWHQLIYDPIQDTSLKKAFENIIEYGYPERAVNFHVSGGFHKLIHDYLGAQFAHSAEGFILELGIHMAIKIVAIASYPLIEPLHLSEYIPNFISRNIIEPTVKFLGIHPLEIVNTVRVLPDRLFGEDNYISNAIDSFTLHRNHYQDRIEDPNYEQFMKGYDLWMEGNDALVHAYDDISVFAKNIQLPRMYQKITYWLEFKIKLYLNTMDVDISREHKISHLRELNIILSHEDNFHENTTCTNESNYSIKSFASSSVTFIGEQLPYLVLPLIFYAYNTMYFDIDALVLDNTQEQRLPDLVEYNPQKALKSIVTKVVIEQTSKVILRSLSEGHLALEHTERVIGIKSYSNSCPDFRKLVEESLTEQSKVHSFSDSGRIDSVANMQGPPATPPRGLPKSGSQEISTIYDQGVVLCGSDWRSFANLMLPRRKQCTTPNCKLSNVKSVASLSEEDSASKYQLSTLGIQVSSAQLSKFAFPLDSIEEPVFRDDVCLRGKTSDESDGTTTLEDISPRGDDFTGSLATDSSEY